MDNSGKYADVILPLALSETYTYSLPPDIAGTVKPGHRVTVQFGRKRIYSAIVWNIHNNPPSGEIKEVLGLLDNYPIVSDILKTFWEWLSDYYLCSLGEVMKVALPSGLKLESQTKIKANYKFDQEELFDVLEDKAYSFIKNNPGTNLEELGSLLKRKNALPLVKQLIDLGAVSLEEKIRHSYKPKIQTAISLNPEIRSELLLNNTLDSLKRAPSQEKCLLSLIDLLKSENYEGKILMTELIRESGQSSNAINALVKKNIFIKESITISRINQAVEEVKKLETLTEEQEKAFEKIKDNFSSNKVSLLHGVTSSGKTEIYIHLIEHEIKKGNQVLYLLPEIALTAQIINRLRAVFGTKVGIFHSRFSDSERVELWKAVAAHDSEVRIVLGARSAVFLPFHKLGLIIIDEEHEVSYKQFDPAPRYQARDAAIVLSRIHHANVLLGSATPSLESYYNARSGKYGLVELNERYTKIQMPEIQIANTREAYRKKKMKGHFTPELLLAIDDALVNNEQVILFQNRRGYSPYMQCNNCGHIPKCRDCDVSLTVHKFRHKMVCHYCGYNEPLYSNCPECSSTGLLAMGMGTEKVEDEIQILFPEAKIARLDLDAARTKHGYSRILEDFENRKTNILIGTQMISKGLDFDHVKLVGIINADNLLHFPDFRSFERSFQLITQVSGRAGRKHNRGQVIVQTSDPTHRILQQVLNNDYLGLYKHEMSERQAFRYPPYSRIIKLNFKHSNQELVNRAAHVFANELRKTWANNILGPQSPPVARIQKLYIRTILIKSGKGNTLTQIRTKINEIRKRMKQDKTFKAVIIQADVDPA